MSNKDIPLRQRACPHVRSRDPHMILNCRYRLYPDPQQIKLLNEWFETCRVSAVLEPKALHYALRELKDWIAYRKSPVDRCRFESEYIMAADYPFPSYHSSTKQPPLSK